MLNAYAECNCNSQNAEAEVINCTTMQPELEDIELKSLTFFAGQLLATRSLASFLLILIYQYGYTGTGRPEL